LLIVIGLGAFIALRTAAPAPRPIARIPTAFAEAMALRHDDCQSSNAHHTPGDAKPDLRLISKQLRDELGFPALVATLDDGWKLEGARICTVANFRTAHLLFTRDGQSLSIFSIPASAVYAGYSPVQGAQYEMTVDQHPIAGFVHGQTIYCAVGKSAKNDLTMAQVKKIIDDLEIRLRDGKTARRDSSLDSSLHLSALASR